MLAKRRDRRAKECCDGVPHRSRDRRQFVYKLYGRIADEETGIAFNRVDRGDEFNARVDDIAFASRVRTANFLRDGCEMVARVRKSRDVALPSPDRGIYQLAGQQIPKRDTDYWLLCPRGHWTGFNLGSEITYIPEERGRRFASSREADRIVSLLNSTNAL